MTPSNSAGPIGVVGLGLVGGSLALALKRRDRSTRIIGCDTDGATVETALAAGAIDAGSTAPDATLDECALLFIATPLPALPMLLPQLRPHLAAGVLLTDVIGIKQPVADAIRQHLPGASFVGGHPMAGGERGGFSQARADLFDGCRVALCPTADAEPADLVTLWRALGATPVVMTADAHDREVAATSHLPYLAALALTGSVSALDPPPTLAGHGLRDATRHAAFSPQVMATVCAANPHLPGVARRFAAELEALARLAETGSSALSERAAEVRDLLAVLQPKA